MKNLKCQESSCGIKPDAVVVDGGGMLHNIYWPSTGTVKDLVDNVEHYLRKASPFSDTYLIFDRYKAGSLKGDTRDARVGSFRRNHQLTVEMELPPKEICLSSSTTKENLIEIMSEELCKRFEKLLKDKRFIVTSKSEVPTEVRILLVLNQDLFWKGFSIHRNILSKLSLNILDSGYSIDTITTLKSFETVCLSNLSRKY